jgi:transcription elongation factor SPT6
MTDSHSSDEEIVKKRRFTKKGTSSRDLKSLFDEENNEDSYEQPNFDEDERSTIFNEIFGTGKEYFYILEDTPEEESSTEILEKNDFNVEDCKRFVMWNTNITNRNLERFVDLLLKGYVLNYILLHDIDYDMDIYTALRVEKSVQEYKKFIEYRSKFNNNYIEDVYSYDAIKYIPKYEENRKDYEDYGTNKYLLSVEQFETNLKDREAVFVPCCYEEGEISGFDEEEYTKQLSSSLVVRDYYTQLYKIYGRIEGEDVYKYYISEEDDQYNDKRKSILDGLIETLKLNDTEIEENILLIEQEFNLFNKVIDRIFNGGLKKMNSQEKIVSCTKEKNLFKGVVMNNLGVVLEKFSKSKNDFDIYLDEIRPVCVVLSGFEPTLRLAMQHLIPRNCVYVENSWFMHLKKDKYEFCRRIGRLALFPEIEYIRLYKTPNGWKDFIGPVHDYKFIVKKAILTAISIVGLDLNLILAQEDNIEILAFLGLTSISRIFSKEVYTSLKDLKEIIGNKIEYVNFLTYIRLFKEFSKIDNPLDEKPIHIENYFIIEEDLDYQKGIQRDDDITGLRITKRDVKRIKECLVDDYRPIFSGFPDNIVFKNLSDATSEIVGSTLEGRVFYVDEGYALVSVLNNVTVFCKIQEKYYPNQLVKCQIEEVNEAFVSFNGIILPDDTPKIKYPRFTKHPLYKEVDSVKAIEFLKESGEFILLRKSTRDNSPILVFKFYADIYAQFKLGPSFSFRGKEHKSIDEVMILVKKTLKKVKEIEQHKNFYEKEEDALKKVGEDGDYIKYGFYFPEEYPGKLCFVFGNRGNIHKEYLGVYDVMTYKGQEYETLDDFLMYRKRM